MSNISPVLYGSGCLYGSDQQVINDLRSSGFTAVIAWAVHVHGSGDLYYNDTKIVTGGHYVGDPEFLSGLKDPPTSITRLLISIGGSNNSDFEHIQNLIASSDGRNTLNQNFQALKSHIPYIDGIDLDDEEKLDQSTIVTFSQMMGELGYQITFCPFSVSDLSTWVDCLYELNTSTSPNLVTGFHLQCYNGGGENDPETWIEAIQKKMGREFDAQGFVYPGLRCCYGYGCRSGNCPDAISDQFASWRPDGIQGGFIWQYDDIHQCETSQACNYGVQMNAAAYADAIVQGLQG